MAKYVSPTWLQYSQNANTSILAAVFQCNIDNKYSTRYNQGLANIGQDIANKNNTD